MSGGIPIYEPLFGSGFSLVVEAKPGASRAAGRQLDLLLRRRARPAHPGQPAARRRQRDRVRRHAADARRRAGHRPARLRRRPGRQRPPQRPRLPLHRRPGQQARPSVRRQRRLHPRHRRRVRLRRRRARRCSSAASSARSSPSRPATRWSPCASPTCAATSARRRRSSCAFQLSDDGGPGAAVRPVAAGAKLPSAHAVTESPVPAPSSVHRRQSDVGALLDLVHARAGRSA